jgi:hypothetical protein
MGTLAVEYSTQLYPIFEFNSFYKMSEATTAEQPASATDAFNGFQWWERMRWIFNLAVGLVGILTIAAYAQHFGRRDIIDLIGYGLFANLFYTLGFWAEMADRHYLSGSLQLSRFRTILFLLGTIGSMALTFAATWAFYNFATAPF